MERFRNRTRITRNVTSKAKLINYDSNYSTSFIVAYLNLHSANKRQKMVRTFSFRLCQGRTSCRSRMIRLNINNYLIFFKNSRSLKNISSSWVFNLEVALQPIFIYLHLVLISSCLHTLLLYVVCSRSASAVPLFYITFQDSKVLYLFFICFNRHDNSPILHREGADS